MSEMHVNVAMFELYFILVDLWWSLNSSIQRYFDSFNLDLIYDLILNILLLNIEYIIIEV